VRKTFQLAEGDFPRLDEYKASLQLSNIARFPRIDRKTLNSLQEMLLQDIPRITSIVAGVINNGPGGALADGDENAYYEGKHTEFKLDLILSDISIYAKLCILLTSVADFSNSN
jgi:hypothetical protein